MLKAYPVSMVSQQQRLAQLRRLRRRPLKWQPLRYSRQRRACNSLRSNRQALKDPLALRSSGDDSKAAQLRQPLLCDTASHEMFLSFPQLSETVPSASVWRSGAAFGVVARGAERQPGHFERNSLL